MTDDTPPNLEKYAAEMYDLLCLIEMYEPFAWRHELENFLKRVRSERDRD